MLKRKNKNEREEDSFSLKQLKRLLKTANEHGCEMLKIFEQYPNDFSQEAQQNLIESHKLALDGIKKQINKKNETHSTQEKR
jgi:hypothetical protein